MMHLVFSMFAFFGVGSGCFATLILGGDAFLKLVDKVLSEKKIDRELLGDVCVCFFFTLSLGVAAYLLLP